MEGDEKKKWRTTILKRAGHMSSYNRPAKLFSFLLMDYEQNYKRMIDYIGSETPYSIIVQYANNMALVNKNEFIRKLINMSNYRWPNVQEKQEEEEIFPQLLNILRQHYTTNELKWIIEQDEKARPYYRASGFVAFMKGNLA